MRGGGGTIKQPEIDAGFPKGAVSFAPGNPRMKGREESEVLKRMKGEGLAITNTGLPVRVTGEITINIDGWPLDKLIKLKQLVEG